VKQAVEHDVTSLRKRNIKMRATSTNDYPQDGSIWPTISHSGRSILL